MESMSETLKINSVTGVDIELEIAGPGGRSYAFVIDWHIRVVLALAWLIVSTVSLTGALSFAGLDDSAGTMGTMAGLVVFVPTVAIYALYHPVIELLMHGRTPGKRMAGIRVVTLDGGTPSFGAILVRNLFRLIDSLPGVYCVGLAMTMLTKNSVRIGDLAAGTVLVYDADRGKSAITDISPAAIERLGLERAELISELTNRWRGLDERVRHRLAREALAAAGQPAEGLDDGQLRAQLEALIR